MSWRINQIQTPTPYAVRCRHNGCNDHDLIFLDTKEYERQLNNPDRMWQCPYCGDDAGWSDSNYEDWLHEDGQRYRTYPEYVQFILARQCNV